MDDEEPQGLSFHPWLGEIVLIAPLTTAFGIVALFGFFAYLLVQW